MAHTGAEVYAALRLLCCVPLADAGALLMFAPSVLQWLRHQYCLRHQYNGPCCESCWVARVWSHLRVQCGALGQGCCGWKLAQQRY
jgi:hypothetical protein